MTTVDIIHMLCRRPRAVNAAVETRFDLLAGIQGICVGAEDSNAEICLGNLPTYIRAHLPTITESWSASLASLCDGKELLNSCEAIADLIVQWKETNPVLPAPRRSRATLIIDGRHIGVTWPDIWSESRMPGVFYHAPAWGKTIDADTFQLMAAVLRHFNLYGASVSTLREALAFLWGITVSRHPPHGSIAGSGDFGTYIRQHFGCDDIAPTDCILLHQLRAQSLPDACALIADLIENWLLKSSTMCYASLSCPICQGGPIAFRICSNHKTIVLVCNTCDAAWLRADKLTKGAAIFPRFTIDQLYCSVATSAGARWATIEELRREHLDQFVIGVATC